MPDIFIAKNNKDPERNNSTPVKKPISTLVNNTTNLEKESNSGTVHLFTSYCENPDDITFENQDEGENVLLFIRKDMITNLPWILAGIFLIIIPFIIPVLTYALHLPLLIIPQSYMLATTILYYLFVTTFLFINFITWYFNIDIVTEKRVVDIDFEGIVYKNVAATKLSLVQDVSYTQVGVVRTIFDFGNVLVQTAGTIDNFTFEAVPRPEDAVHVVENLIGKNE